MIDESVRRAILAELAAVVPELRQMEPWMFTLADFCTAMGWLKPRAERYLRQQVARGAMRMDLDGYDPRTGRKAALYWRVEDEGR